MAEAAQIIVAIGLLVFLLALAIRIIRLGDQ